FAPAALYLVQLKISYDLRLHKAFDAFSRLGLTKFNIGILYGANPRANLAFLFSTRLGYEFLLPFVFALEVLFQFKDLAKSRDDLDSDYLAYIIL
ncbi:hypothetical protein HAX54_038497, partial [Datura stramonium]|nr:hypothetical protein [Datura stramonium]